MKLCIIILLNLILYIRTLKYSIIVDDIRQYADIKRRLATKGKQVSNIYRRLYGGGTFGLNTIYDHALTIFLHTLACCLIYVALGKNDISFWASILYSFNPINNQTSIWLNGRRYLMNIIILLSMLALGSWAFPLYFATFPFQVTALFAPILYIDQSWLYLLFIPLAVLLGKDKFIEKMNSRLERIFCEDHKKFKMNRIIVIIKQYGFYFTRMIFPGRIMMNYKFLYFWGVTKEGNEDAYAFNKDFVKGIISLILTITGLFYFKDQLFLFWLFMFLSTLQWCGLVTSVQQVTDRYVSMPNIFMMFFVSYLAHTLVPQYALAIIIGLCGYYLAYLSLAMKMYKSIEDFFKYQLFFEPTLSKIACARIDAYLKFQEITEGWIFVKESLKSTPNDFELLYRAAICSRMVGQTNKAREFLEKASKNYYVGLEELQKDKIKKFNKSLDEIDISIKKQQEIFQKEQEKVLKKKKKKKKPTD